MMRRNEMVGGFLVAVGLVMAIPAAHAGLGVDFTTPGVDYTTSAWSLGWEFNVISPILVTHLGFYDDGKNGLTESHKVGIFDSSANLLVSGTVSHADPLESWWRWTSVTPTLLPAGDGYHITALTGRENYTWEPSKFTMDPAILFVGDDLYVDDDEPPSTELRFPNKRHGTIGWFGPNFKFTTAPPIPEASTLVLLGLGLVGLVGATRRRK